MSDPYKLVKDNKELRDILSAYRLDMPIVISPDHFNHWNFRVIDRKTCLVLVPVEITSKEELK